MDNERLRIINEKAKEINYWEKAICEFEDSIRYIFNKNTSGIIDNPDLSGIIDNPDLVLESVLSITRRHYKTNLETLKKEFSLM